MNVSNYLFLLKCFIWAGNTWTWELEKCCMTIGMCRGLYLEFGLLVFMKCDGFNLCKSFQLFSLALEIKNLISIWINWLDWIEYTVWCACISHSLFFSLFLSFLFSFSDSIVNLWMFDVMNERRVWYQNLH